MVQKTKASWPPFLLQRWLLYTWICKIISGYYGHYHLNVWNGGIEPIFGSQINHRAPDLAKWPAIF